jgi:hypothetical protein
MVGTYSSAKPDETLDHTKVGIKLLVVLAILVLYYPGSNFITEEFEMTGAIILHTPEGQTDLACRVQGKNVIGFAEDEDLVLEDLSLQSNSQYFKHLPAGQLRTELYSCTPPGMTRMIGEMVDYQPDMRDATLYSNKVAETFGSSNVVNWRAENTRGEQIIINIGSGFQTADGLGVVLEMGQNGVVLKWRELWDQKYFNTKYPCVIQNMSQYDVLETNVEHSDQVCGKSILQVFPILPGALIQPKDQFGKGARFLVGVVNFESDSPMKIYGLNAVKGEELL